ERLVNLCYSTLDPPFTPEILDAGPVGEDGAIILIVRVDPDPTLRPVFYQGQALIRHEGRNAPADRHRLRQLFNEAGTPLGTVNPVGLGLTAHPLWGDDPVP